jgi:hypothetical protein
VRVLVIPEDPRLDRYILEPIIKAMLEAVGRRHATVRICNKRLLRSVEQALRWERIREIMDLYGDVQLFLLIVDRDSDEHRRQRLDAIERQAAELLSINRGFFAEHAWQEVEVWALAGCDDLPRAWAWRDVRAERDPKEVYFTPYAQQRGLQDEPGGGRKTLGIQAARRYNRVRQRCPEDIGALEERIRAWINRRAPAP